MGYSVDLVLFRYWVASSIPCIDCIGTNIKSNSSDREPGYCSFEACPNSVNCKVVATLVCFDSYVWQLIQTAQTHGMDLDSFFWWAGSLMFLTL